MKKGQIVYQNQTCHTILLPYLTRRNLSIFEQCTTSTTIIVVDVLHCSNIDRFLRVKYGSKILWHV